MKTFTPYAVLFTTLLLLFGGAGPAKACDRSQISLDSISVGTTVEVFIRMEIGGGVTGATRGASGSTGTFAFAFYGAPTVAPLGFPASITSDSTQVTNNAFNAGPAFGSQFTIGYLSPGSPYACINSTAICGNAHTDIKQVRFELTELPDSIRLLGVEGDGNPFSGCFPNLDMLIDFSILPVEWVSFEANVYHEAVVLKWITAQETNNAWFEVEHSTDGTHFNSIGIEEAVGNSDAWEDYAFTDASPRKGLNHYRIRQVDKDGKSTTSKVQSVSFAQRKELAWVSRGVNPVVGGLQMQFQAPEANGFSVQVFDQRGTLVFAEHKEGNSGINSLEMDMTQLPAGIFHLVLRSNGQSLRHKILKIQ